MESGTGGSAAIPEFAALLPGYTRSVIRKLLGNRDDRLFFAGIVVIAANAGGAWSPIGDVTTTMRWIGGQITAPRPV